MEPTYLENPQIGDVHSGSQSAHARLHTFDHSGWPTTEPADEIGIVDFTSYREEKFAQMLDDHEVSWRYKSRSFAVEWDDQGNFVDSFTPDFYLPGVDLYLELVALEDRSSGDKARKVRMLRQQQPGIRIELIGSASLSDLFEGVLLTARH